VLSRNWKFTRKLILFQGLGIPFLDDTCIMSQIAKRFMFFEISSATSRQCSCDVRDGTYKSMKIRFGPSICLQSLLTLRYVEGVEIT
jgi:hypothetical protein